MARMQDQSAVEWMGGLALLPAWVTGEGEPYRPEALIWIDANGCVLGHEVGAPGDVVGRAAASLRRAIEQPMVGRPHAPDRLRVASAELAQALQAAGTGIEIVCAPTPEVDEVLAAMCESFGEGAGGPDDVATSYLGHGIGPDAMAAMFRAAAGLYRAKPWEIVPDDGHLISVTIEALGVRDQVVSIIGQMGESFGFVLFPSRDDFRMFADAVEVLAAGGKPALPSHVSLNFERGAELDVALLDEIGQHGWEVAGPDAYPWLVVVEPDLVGRTPSASELVIVEAISLALTMLLADEAALLEAWEGGAPVERGLTGSPPAGRHTVTLRVAADVDQRDDAGPVSRVELDADRLVADQLDAQQLASRSSPDLMAALFDLDKDIDDIDDVYDSASEALEGELFRRFARSEEARGLPDPHWCEMILRYAADYLGVTVATLDARGLREIVFEVIPSQVSVGADVAPSIITESRAFWSFLKRETGLEQADACLDVLGGDAVGRLEAELMDPRNFGMAKSLVMGTLGAGDRWSSPLAPEPGMSRGATRPKKDKEKEKEKRKAARKSRKRNR